ncbi:MAG: hypothetical protein L6V93_02900 [Clostridiales bacterium]|nr:MAG: hypothetical protein L6V93_02900 [Clostridiales bacterium]
MRFSTNPYNINAMTMALGEGIFGRRGLHAEKTAKIIDVRLFAEKRA